jgi:hypothetical protein
MKNGPTLPGLAVPKPDGDMLLRWIVAAIRVQKALPWFSARRPRRFIYAVPPSTN